MTDEQKQTLIALLGSVQEISRIHYFWETNRDNITVRADNDRYTIFPDGKCTVLRKVEVTF